MAEKSTAEMLGSIASKTRKKNFEDASKNKQIYSYMYTFP